MKELSGHNIYSLQKIILSNNSFIKNYVYILFAIVKISWDTKVKPFF